MIAPGGGLAVHPGVAPCVILTGRVLAGIGGAILIVLMSKMITDWFAGKELFLGMAIFIIGWPVGIAAGQATQDRSRGAFVLAGGVRPERGAGCPPPCC